MLKFDKASGLYYDRDTASVYVDENGTTFMGSFNPDCSDAYLKLFLLFCIENDSAKLENDRRKKEYCEKNHIRLIVIPYNKQYTIRDLL